MMVRARPRGPGVLAALLTALAVLALVLHSLAFNFVTDDAFISFVYSRNLAQHGALVFNLGERVEGYTNFLWTVLIGALLRAGISAEISSRVLGTLCGAATLVVCTLAMRRLRPCTDGRASAWDAVPALILCEVPGYACWSSGGLETQLFTLLVTLASVLYLLHLADAPNATGSLAPVGAVFGLAALTRPEGLLFFGLTGLFQMGLLARAGGWRGLVPRRRELAALGWFLLLVAPHLLWRRWYYGYWVPNTFYVKSSGGMAAWQQGAFYLYLFAAQQKLFVLPLLAIWGLFSSAEVGAQRRYRTICCYVLLLGTVFLLYVASVGGDFMGLHRFVMPVVPLHAICGAAGLWLGLRALGRRLCRTSPGHQALEAGGVGLLLVLHGANSYRTDLRALRFIGADQGIDTPGYLRYYTADRAAIGKWLGQNVQPDDYQVVGGAGAQVYYAGIRALDSFGLCDEYVAHRTPALSTRPGHQKFAPLDYVLSRRPTILTYNIYKIQDAPYRPTQQEAAQWRARGFHYVSVQVPGLSKPWYSFLKRIDRTLGPLPKADDID